MTVEPWILHRGRSMLCAGLVLALSACSPGGAPNSNGDMAGMMQGGMPMMRDMPEGMMPVRA